MSRTHGFMSFRLTAGLIPSSGFTSRFAWMALSPVIQASLSLKTAELVGIAVEDTVFLLVGEIQAFDTPDDLANIKAGLRLKRYVRSE